jgi:trans-2,3-dihydro-3-hydroxyanthranilate isomerase
MKLNFHLVNVFAESRLQGNPLCVFENADMLSTEQMQALALQFNLSETCFLCRSQSATAQMRIFTPAYELPFAGHPTLGTAHIVRHLTGHQQVTLETKVGNIEVNAQEDQWTFKVAVSPTTRAATADNEQLAYACGLSSHVIVGTPGYADTGTEQFFIQVDSQQSVRDAAPSLDRLRNCIKTVQGRAMVYIFALLPDHEVVSRFFFTTASGLSEDPGTGSAAANLMAFLLARGWQVPFSLKINQGEQTGRRCVIYSSVDNQRAIFVGGRCVRIGGGTIEL